MSADEIETETLVEGKGDEIADGDTVFLHFTVENGFDQQRTFSTYDEAGGGAQSVTVDEGLLPALRDGVVGSKAGSRVAVVGPAEEGFGPSGNSGLGIGNEDTFLVIVDVTSKVLDKAEGKAQPAPAWAPKIVEKGGEPTALDFTGTPPPVEGLRTAVLIEGTGPVVPKDGQVVVNYLGQVHGGEKPFDESYTKQPFPANLAGGVVKGWSQGLAGQKVGSRVLLAVPPHLGYGAKGRAPDITGTDTMYFVVDLLGTS